jgi:hypothetical protein
MSLDLRNEFAAACPQEDQTPAFSEKGSKHSGYNDSSMADSLQRFCDEFLPKTPLVDPRGKKISIEEGNFPKLANLEHKTLKKEDFPAFQILQCLRDGTYDPSHYINPELDRLRTLFWIPELITDPDSIYRNGHKIIPADEVYVRVYDKEGARVKLFFSMDLWRKGKVIRTIPVSSFLTDPHKVSRFITGKPLYVRPLTTKPPE